MTAEGFSRAEMRSTARDLRNRLYSVPGVSKVDLFGVEEERIYIEFNNVRLAQIGLTAQGLIDAVSNTNVISPGGRIEAGIASFAVEPTGNFNSVFDIGKCKIGIVICYDNQFPEVPRIVALKGADVILMPHAARQGMWDDTPESEAAARRHVFDYFSSSYRMRARENACYCVYADQAGRAGYVDAWPRDHCNQPHHPGGAMAIGPDGNILEHTQLDRICDEMIVCDLSAELLGRVRSHPNYTLRTRRPELFGELVRDQVSC